MTTRLLMAGDTGANPAPWQYLVKIARAFNCQAVYQAGDTGYNEADNEGREYTNNLASLAQDSGVSIAFIDGNHEVHRQLWSLYQNAPRSAEGFWQLRPSLFYIPRGHAWTVEGVRFLGLGGAYSVDKAQRLRIERDTGRPGSMWSPDEELTDADVARAIAQGTVDIMLTHDKPRSSNPHCDFTSKPACWPNQDRVSAVMQAAEPDLLVHGHLHFPYEDHVRVGREGKWCQVISLESDELGSRNRPYDARNSWLIIEVRGKEFTLQELPPALIQ